MIKTPVTMFSQIMKDGLAIPGGVYIKKLIKEMLTKLSEKTKTQNCTQARTCVCVHVCVYYAQ